MPFDKDTKDTNPKDLIGQKKLPLWLIPPSAKAGLAEALADGAAKYGPYNWREKGVNNMVYVAAAMRHIDAYLDGEDCAKDSGVQHLAHAMACFAIVLDAQSVGNLTDGRPLPGVASDLQEQYYLKNSKE